MRSWSVSILVFIILKREGIIQICYLLTLIEREKCGIFCH